MDTPAASQQVSLEPYDSRRLASLCGRLDEHIKQIADRLQVDIRNRGNLFHLSGDSRAVQAASTVLNDLYAQTADTEDLTPEMVHLHLQQSELSEKVDNTVAFPSDDVVIRTKRVRIKPRGGHQREYVKTIRRFDINFGIGPAGTGKTWLAVACAVDALEKSEVQRILLVRPAVEAGEKLGFLPGDLAEKIDPYLRPLYDALYEMLGFEKVAKLMDRLVIEVAPLAYMRGRTLNNSFVILDEAQNTTPEQMKIPDPHRLRLQGGDHRRRHPGGSAAPSEVRAGQCPGGARRRTGNRRHPFRQPRRGPPPAGATHSRGLRPS